MIKKIIIFIVLLIVTAFIILISLFEFRISDEVAMDLMKVSNHQIQFGDVTVAGRNIHYAYSGKEKDILIVFVHGSPGSWNAFIDYFKADSLLETMDMVSMDRAGFGNSGFGEAEPNLELQALHLKAITDEFPHKDKILIGHSLGGPVVARAAMDYPNLFSGMILVAPSVDPEMEKEEWYRGIIDTEIGGMFTPIEFEVSNDEILPLKEELELMVPLWDKVQIPTIVIQGTADQLVPKENADFVIAKMPEELLEVVILEGVNHFIPWSDSDEIIKAIQRMSNGLYIYHP